MLSSQNTLGFKDFDKCVRHSSMIYDIMTSSSKKLYYTKRIYLLVKSHHDSLKVYDINSLAERLKKFRLISYIPPQQIH